jgi:hypothetical protein
MSQRNATLRDRLEREAGAGREAFRSTVAGARGNRTVLKDSECSDPLTAAGVVTVGPGEKVVTVRPQDNRGRRLSGVVQVLPDQPAAIGGAAAFPGTRRSSSGDPVALAGAIPDVAPAGATTETLFVGTGLRKDPLTEISAVTSDGTQIDDEVLVSGLSWVADPQSANPDIGPGMQAIRGDVIVDGGAIVGRPIFFAIG